MTKNSNNSGNNTGNNSAEDRRPTEAQASTRTTQFLAYLAAVGATFVTGVMVVPAVLDMNRPAARVRTSPCSPVPTVAGWGSDREMDQRRSSRSSRGPYR